MSTMSILHHNCQALEDQLTRSLNFYALSNTCSTGKQMQWSTYLIFKVCDLPDMLCLPLLNKLTAAGHLLTDPQIMTNPYISDLLPVTH